MSPEQLEALASRARRRVGEGDKSGGDKSPKPPKPPRAPKPLDTLVRVQSPDPEDARPQIEAVLATQVKEWKFSGTQRDAAGSAVLEYRVRLRKSIPAPVLTGELRTRLGSRATGVETR
jgi:hypothetical protein